MTLLDIDLLYFKINPYKMKTNPILERLIIFNNDVFNNLSVLQDLRTTNYLVDQIFRSTSSAALNYSEAILSSSDRDYANKVRISLKEINETSTILKLIESRAPDSLQNLDKLKKEADELTAILSTCCRKAEAKFKK